VINSRAEGIKTPELLTTIVNTIQEGDPRSPASILDDATPGREYLSFNKQSSSDKKNLYHNTITQREDFNNAVNGVNSATKAKPSPRVPVISKDSARKQLAAQPNAHKD